ncbi:MAG: hypothetical protein E7291_00345 [Lachnospiraceae bacterium]|nr:hypothetical protein [Lachnospiraceae bacterium]
MNKTTRVSNNFSKNFLRCGLIGWCMEIIFTALNSLRRRDFRLQGTTSIWMFPIYGCAAFLKPISLLLKSRPFWVRGLTYMSLIFSAEFLTGSLLQRRALCPWDYQRSRWNIRRLVRLDYAPYWFGAGLLFEQMLAKTDKKLTPPPT